MTLLNFASLGAKSIYFLITQGAAKAIGAIVAGIFVNVHKHCNS
jgi:hypothetical protein